MGFNVGLGNCLLLSVSLTVTHEFTDGGNSYVCVTSRSNLHKSDSTNNTNQTGSTLCYQTGKGIGRRKRKRRRRSLPVQSLILEEGDMFYGGCSVSGTPTPLAQWIFCSLAVSTDTDSNSNTTVTPDSDGQSVSCVDRTDKLPDIAMLNLSSVGVSDSGVFVCAALFIDVVEHLWNVTANVTPAAPDCWRPPWPWFEAAIVISTVAVVVAVCIIVLVAFSCSSQAGNRNGERNSNIVLVAVSLCLAIGIWIGSAISLSQTNGSSSSSSLTASQYVYDQTKGWLIGTIVIGLVEMVIVDAVVLTVIVLSIVKDSEKVNNRIVNICSSVLRILLHATVLTWTIVVGEKYKENCSADYGSTVYWTWQIFLITGACALVVAVVLFVSLWCCRDKCSGKDDEDNFCTVCTLITTACRCQQRSRRLSQVGAVTDDISKKVTKNKTATNEQNRPASGRIAPASPAIRRSSQSAINQEGSAGATKTHTVTFPMTMESPNRPRLEPIYGRDDKDQTSPRKKRKKKKRDQQEQDGGQGDDGNVANGNDEQQKKKKKKKHRDKKSPDESSKKRDDA